MKAAEGHLYMELVPLSMQQSLAVNVHTVVFIL